MCGQVWNGNGICFVTMATYYPLKWMTALVSTCDNKTEPELLEATLCTSKRVLFRLLEIPCVHSCTHVHMHVLNLGDVVERSDCILVYGSTTKGDVVKRSDCILVYGSTTKGDVVERSDCILVYGSTTKGGVIKRSDCILVYGSTTKSDVVRRSDCILVYGSTTKGDVVERSDCILGNYQLH